MGLKNRGAIADVALTAAGFIPGVGAAAWAYRAYKAFKATRYAGKLFKNPVVGAGSRLFCSKAMGRGCEAYWNT